MCGPASSEGRTGNYGRARPVTIGRGGRMSIDWTQEMDNRVVLALETGTLAIPDSSPSVSASEILCVIEHRELGWNSTRNRVSMQDKRIIELETAVQTLEGCNEKQAGIIDGLEARNDRQTDLSLRQSTKIRELRAEGWDHITDRRSTPRSHTAVHVKYSVSQGSKEVLHETTADNLATFEAGEILVKVDSKGISISTSPRRSGEEDPAKETPSADDV